MLHNLNSVNTHLSNFTILFWWCAVVFLSCSGVLYPVLCIFFLVWFASVCLCGGLFFACIIMLLVGTGWEALMDPWCPTSPCSTCFMHPCPWLVVQAGGQDGHLPVTHFQSGGVSVLAVRLHRVSALMFCLFNAVGLKVSLLGRWVRAVGKDLLSWPHSFSSPHSLELFVWGIYLGGLEAGIGLDYTLRSCRRTSAVFLLVDTGISHQYDYEFVWYRWSFRCSLHSSHWLW